LRGAVGKKTKSVPAKAAAPAKEKAAARPTRSTTAKRRHNDDPKLDAFAFDEEVRRLGPGPSRTFRQFICGHIPDTFTFPTFTFPTTVPPFP
jgi:hypothetical protein